MKWYDIKARANNTATVYIFGDIGESWWGESVTAKQFVKDLDAVTAETIDFRINSMGGSVVDGLAIHNAIKRKQGTKTVYIDGLAASIASLIAMAGDTVEIASNAMVMVHAPWGGVRGNAAEMREMADLLDKWAESMASSYASKTGKSKDEILAILKDGEDHWYDAQEAVDFGFADRVGGVVELAASFNLSRYKTPPAVIAALSRKPDMTPEEKAALEAKIRAEAEAKVRAEFEAKAKAEADAKAKADAELAAKAKAEAEAKAALEVVRVSSLNAVFDRYQKFEFAAELKNQLIADGKSDANDARTAILAKLSEMASPVMGGIYTVADSRDKMVTGVTAAIEARAGLGKDDTANNFRSFSLYDIARECLRAAGYRDWNGNKLQIVASAFTHSTSDFPKILENIANKSMLRGWEEAEENLSWTSKGSLTDFKTAKRVDLNLFPNLALKPEGGEYSYATVGERGESVILATYGKAFSMTRELVINDDLDMLSRIPNRMGRAAKRTVANLAWSAMLDNPTMSDSVALFHADHNNLISSGTAISTASVDVMQTKMRLQKDVDSIASAGLNIRMKYLICPVAKEGLAKTVRESQFRVDTNTDNTVPNSVKGTFEVISDPRVDASSATAWYGVADPAAHDGIEIQYLNGVETPFMDQEQAWSVDGVRMKVRIDAAAKALDFRTLVKNAGA